MDILSGIKARKSIRAYKSEAVPMDVLIEILRVSIQAPSGVNSQPWEFYIVTGKVLDELKRRCVEQFRSGIKLHPDIAVPDSGLTGVHKERQIQLAKQVFAIMKITKGDQKRLDEYYELMYSFYHAPAVIVIVVDNMLEGGWPLIDIGVIAQTIALAAQEFELGTCIMRAIIDYPELVRELLNVPDTKKLIVGIAIGYPDWDHPLNTLQTERESLENILMVIK
jgi:nitroreductase